MGFAGFEVGVYLIGFCRGLRFTASALFWRFMACAFHTALRENRSNRQAQRV